MRIGHPGQIVVRNHYHNPCLSLRGVEGDCRDELAPRARGAPADVGCVRESASRVRMVERSVANNALPCGGLACFRHLLPLRSLSIAHR